MGSTNVNYGVSRLLGQISLAFVNATQFTATWYDNRRHGRPTVYRLYNGVSELFFPSSKDYDMSIGNSVPAWPSVIVSNGRILPSLDYS